MKIDELKIDPEFKGFLRELTSEEYTELDKQIVHEGLLSPICVWKGVIVDGHNRYKILKDHNIQLNDSDVKELHFSSRYEAIVWICKHQTGRRNLTDAEKKYLIGKRLEAEKQMRGSVAGKERRENGRFVQRHQNDASGRQPGKTSDIIAKELGIGKATVERDEKFAKGVDAAEEAVPGSKEKIMKGEIKVPAKDIVEIAKIEKEERPRYIEELSKPKEERTTKICAKCGKKLPILHFYKNSDICKQCIAKQNGDGETKECQSCGRILPVSAFHFDKRFGIYAATCKECTSWETAKKDSLGHLMGRGEHISYKDMIFDDGNAHETTIDEVIITFNGNFRQYINNLKGILKDNKEIIRQKENREKVYKMFEMVTKTIEEMKGEYINEG